MIYLINKRYLTFQDEYIMAHEVKQCDDPLEIYRRLMDFTGDGIYRYTFEDGKILFANPGFLKILDLPGKPEDLIGKYMKDVLVYIEPQRTIRDLTNEKGELHNFEYHFKTLKGEEKYVIHDSFILEDHATGAKIVEAVIKDITSRKKTEQELKKYHDHLEDLVKERTRLLEATNKELEAFSYSVSHDLRAPLRAIDGFVHILLEDYAENFDDDGKRVMGIIDANAKRMGKLIEDLLSLSRYGRVELNKTLISMEVLAKKIAGEVRALQPQRDITFSVMPLPPANGDPILLRQVWTNLISNAMKFTKTREKAIVEIGGSAGKIENTYYVRDNGVGFDPNYADKLFGAFQRLHGREEFEGTGIGLATVQRIIHRHGGSVKAESVMGQGAVFYFTLPNT